MILKLIILKLDIYVMVLQELMGQMGLMGEMEQMGFKSLLKQQMKVKGVTVKWRNQN